MLYKYFLNDIISHTKNQLNTLYILKFIYYMIYNKMITILLMRDQMYNNYKM